MQTDTTSEWLKPPALIALSQMLIATIVGLWVFFGQLPAPGQLETLKTEIGKRLDMSDRRTADGMDRLQAQMQLLPTVDARLGAVERGLLADETRGAARDSQISDIKQSVATDHANLQATMRDVQALQDKANGRFQGERR